MIRVTVVVGLAALAGLSACGASRLVASDTCADWRGASTSEKRDYVHSQRGLADRDVERLDRYCADTSNRAGQRLPLRRIVKLVPGGK